MSTLAQLRSGLQTNETLAELLEVLKMAAVARLARLQEHPWGLARFSAELIRSLALLGRAALASHAFIRRDAGPPRLLLLISTEEGFSGGLNAQLVQALLGARSGETDRLLIIGRKGCAALDELRVPFSFFPQLGRRITMAQLHALQAYISESFARGEVNEVVVVYGDFVSLSEHVIRVRRLLPFAVGRVEPVAVPERDARYVERDPDTAAVVEALVRLDITATLVDIFYAAKLTEYSTRMLHLERSHQELMEQRRQLQAVMFKKSHAQADRRLREVYAAQLLRRRTRRQSCMTVV